MDVVIVCSLLFLFQCCKYMVIVLVIDHTIKNGWWEATCSTS